MQTLRASWFGVEKHWTWYRRNWRATVVSSFLSPLLFLVALGLGFGSQVQSTALIGGVPYLQYLAPALVVVLSAAAVARPADPPKDTAALLELLLEILVANGIRLPADAAVAINTLQIGGRGNAVRKELLSLA